MDARHDVNPVGPSSGVAADLPDVIPSFELKGSLADRLKTLDTGIAHLQELRRTLAGAPPSPDAPYDLHGRYLNAPVWPWFAAGWVVGALFVVLFLVAWSWA